MPERFKAVCIPCKVLYTCSALPNYIKPWKMRPAEWQVPHGYTGFLACWIHTVYTAIGELWNSCADFCPELWLSGHYLKLDLKFVFFCIIVLTSPPVPLKLWHHGALQIAWYCSGRPIWTSKWITMIKPVVLEVKSAANDKMTHLLAWESTIIYKWWSDCVRRPAVVIGPCNDWA